MRGLLGSVESARMSSSRDFFWGSGGADGVGLATGASSTGASGGAIGLAGGIWCTAMAGLGAATGGATMGGSAA